jgi:hypothetical protein
MFALTKIGPKDAPYPMMDAIWDFFSTKGVKTVFLSIGSGPTCLPELELAETIGCPLLKLETPETAKPWTEIKELLKTRKATETTSEFAKPAARKWVLPKNLLVVETLPSFTAGTITVNGTQIACQRWHDILAQTGSESRIDLLKLEWPGLEAMLLESLWQSGLRPSLLLVTWSASPDEETTTMNTAAHLQMLGYALVGKEGLNYLYYYTDVNYYETCEWSVPSIKMENPLMREMFKSLYPGSKGGISFPKVEKEASA